MNRDPIITLTTDFGNREYYVGAVKGAILSGCPSAKIVDISHQVASHDLLEAAFTLSCSYSAFPSRTIHLVVVDPGVGSDRRGIIAVTEHHYFIGPDNGVLSLIYQKEEISRVVSIEADHYFIHPVSPTFHARDLFAPVAANLARGISVSKFGPEIKDYVRLTMPQAKKVSNESVEGIVLHVDKFGNIITSLRPKEIEALVGSEFQTNGFTIQEQQIKEHCRYYSEAGQPFFSLLGSSGYYEISALKKPAARLLNVRRGAKVSLALTIPSP